MMSKTTSHILLLLGLLAGACVPAPFAALQAQGSGAFTDFTDIRPKQNSPLSRFGLGDPLDLFHAAQAGMGGIEATYQNPYHLNILNPASLAYLQASSFEIGLYGRSSNLQDATSSATTYQGNLRYLALGFPLRNPINLNLDRALNTWNAGMAFSLVPLTLVGYDLNLQEESPEFGTTSNSLKGNGGTYRFSWATAFRYKKLSAGVSLGYNFGKLTNDRLVFFDSIPEALGTELLDEFSINGASFGYGLQYNLDFTTTDEAGEKVYTGKRMIFGVNGRFESDIESESSTLFRRFSPSGGLFVTDTLSFTDGELGTVTLPLEYTIGVAYEEINKLYLGIEYGQRKYGNYRSSDRPSNLADVNRFALGVQYIPRISSFNNYWERVRYRAGFRAEDDPRVIDGAQARRTAVTIGAGFPIRLPRQQISFLDVAFEFGKFGVPDVIDEDYVQLTLGFSLNDNSWFFKRKLN